MTIPTDVSPLPPDDPTRTLAVARPETDQTLPHIALVGDTYTVLLTGAQTAGRFTLIDMLIPPGGGPPRHRHDFEETFTLLEGEVELIFRTERLVLRAGETVNIPANAPHQFRNIGGQPARMLCLCAPAGQEEYFAAIGTPVPTRTTPAPHLDEQTEAAFRAKALALALQYRSEFLPPE